MENREIMDLKDTFLQTRKRNNLLCKYSGNQREIICCGWRTGVFLISTAVKFHIGTAGAAECHFVPDPSSPTFFFADGYLFTPFHVTNKI